MRLLHTIRDNVVSALVASIFIGLAVLAWEKATDGGLISLLQGVTKTELEKKLREIPKTSELNERLTLQCS